MKHLICLLLAFVQIDGFGQAETEKLYLWSDGKFSVLDPGPPIPAIPDTLRAICLITTCPNGKARARMGFVVIAQGKRPIYLDCRKKALKLPQVGWGYELINPNKET